MKGALGMRNVQEANGLGIGQSVPALTHVNNYTEFESVTGGKINLEAVAFGAVMGGIHGGPAGAVAGAIFGAIFG
jgi:hypothetical protein